MAKRLIVFLLIAGAAYFIYQRTNRTTSEEEQLVASLQDRYAVVVNEFLSAAGRSGAIGMDTTYDAETAVVQIQKLRAELAELRRKLTEEKAVAKARALAEKIDEFCKKNDIT